MAFRKRPPPRSRKIDGGARKDPPDDAPAAAVPESAGGDYWLYGVHPLRGALANPRRRLHRVLVTAEARRRLPALPAGAEEASNASLSAALPAGAVHQGCAALAVPLTPPTLSEVLDSAGTAPLVVLDQITDPHNVGAILRSAAAFGAAAVITTRRRSPPESGALAKAAAGGLDAVPLLRVGNLARVLARLAQAGWWLTGLDAQAPRALPQARLPRQCALVLGAEGTGLRRLTREACDECVALPLPGAIDSLNVSNACAIALYALTAGGSAPA